VIALGLRLAGAFAVGLGALGALHLAAAAR